jgi:hypothetical protein
MKASSACAPDSALAQKENMRAAGAWPTTEGLAYLICLEDKNARGGDEDIKLHPWRV